MPLDTWHEFFGHGHHGAKHFTDILLSFYKFSMKPGIYIFTITGKIEPDLGLCSFTVCISEFADKHFRVVVYK